MTYTGVDLDNTNVYYILVMCYWNTGRLTQNNYVLFVTIIILLICKAKHFISSLVHALHHPHYFIDPYTRTGDEDVVGQQTHDGIFGQILDTFSLRNKGFKAATTVLNSISAPVSFGLRTL